MKRIRLSIKTQIVSVLGLLLIVSLSGLLAMTAYTFYGRTRVSVEEENRNWTQILAAQAKTFLQATQDKVRVLGAVLHEERDLARKSSVETNFFKINPSFVLVAVLEQSMLAREASLIPHALSPEYRGERVWSEIWSEITQKRASFSIAKSFSEDTIQLRAFDLPGEGVELGLVSVAPLVKSADGKVTHVAVAILKPHELLSALGKVGSDVALDERVSYLVNAQGYLVLHPDAARSMREESMSTYPIVKDMVEGKSSDAATQQYRSADGNSVVWGALAKVGYAGLSVVTEKSEAHSLAPIKKVLETSGFLALMILFLAFLLGYLYSFTITSPIQKLVRATQQITEGDFKVVLKDEGSDEIARLSSAFTEMARGLEERDRVKATFSKFHSKEIAEKLLSGEVSLGGERKAAVIFFSDVRGFTEMSERLQPEEVVEMLNEYMTLMVAVITRNGGVVDKYVGDAIMALWGVPIEGSDDARNAVQACLEMRSELASLNARRMERGQEPLRIGMGLNYGEVIAGNIGSNEKMDYTVIGDSVNLASRIESMTKAYGTDLLISGSVHERIEGRFICEAAKSARVKGKSNAIEVYHVRGTIDSNGNPTIIETPWSTYKASSDEKVSVDHESTSRQALMPPPFRGERTGMGFGFNTVPKLVVPPPFRGERTRTLTFPSAPEAPEAQRTEVEGSKPVIRRRVA